MKNLLLAMSCHWTPEFTPKWGQSLMSTYGLSRDLGPRWVWVSSDAFMIPSLASFCSSVTHYERIKKRPPEPEPQTDLPGLASGLRGTRPLIQSPDTAALM